MHVYRGINIKRIHIFQFKKSITVYFVYVCFFYIYRCILLQVQNLNLVTNFDFFFNAMLITYKCTSLCKELDCDVKSEPPYLATTLMTKS
jgi:hypothetical protein